MLKIWKKQIESQGKEINRLKIKMEKDKKELKERIEKLEKKESDDVSDLWKTTNSLQTSVKSHTSIINANKGQTRHHCKFQETKCELIVEPYRRLQGFKVEFADYTGLKAYCDNGYSIRGFQLEHCALHSGKFGRENPKWVYAKYKLHCCKSLGL